MSKLLYNDENLIKFELEEQWDRSVVYLRDKLLTKCEDKSILCRLAAQCWYVLVHWDICMPKERLDKNLFQMNFELAYNITQKKYMDDTNCLWLWGYFMCINQEIFPFINLSFIEIEEMGNEYICEAYFMDSCNPLIEILYLADNGNKRERVLAKERIRKNINIYFSDNSVVEQYFIEIFTRIHQ